MVVSAGKKGEDDAVLFLKKEGYRILVRNFRSRFGEVDIIALDRNVLVFIEVKARSTNLFGSPSEAINYFKLQKIYKTAQYFQIMYPKLPKNIRFDAIEVFFNTNSDATINHIKNISL